MNSPFSCISDFLFIDNEVIPADVILIPGGSHPQQMIKACELYHQGIATLILPSGGFNSKLGETEWNYLRRIGLNNNVPDKAILREDQAQHTFDNATLSWEVLQKSNIIVNSVILICKAQHARRALMTYQTIFPKEVNIMVASVAENREITRDNWFLEESKIKVVMTEVEKIGKYFGKHIANWVDR